MKKHLIKLVTAITLIAIIATLAFTGCGEEAAEYSLKITAIGEGTTSPAPGTYTKTEGESVTVTATPATGYELDRWEGDVSGTDDSITLKMTSDKSVVAVFVEGVPAWEWPETLLMLSGAAGTVGHAVLTGWTPLLADDTGMKVRVVPEGSLTLRWTWTGQGLFFYNPMAPGEVAEALTGEGGYATRDGGPYQVRMMWSLSKMDGGYVVRGDSSIETIYDIKPGCTIVYMSFVPTGEDLMKALLAWVEVDPEDVTWLPASSGSAAMRAITEGRADVGFYFPTGTAAYEAEGNPYGLRWLDLNAEEDPEGAKRYLEVSPLMTFGEITTGVPSAQGAWGTYGLYFMGTRAETDPELVYRFAKWLDENFDRYKDIHDWCQYMSIDYTMQCLETGFIPAHEGLVKYLKEKDLWTAAHDARQAENIELISRYIDAYQKAIDKADETGITVDPGNEEWMTLWESYKQDLPSFSTFVGLD